MLIQERATVAEDVEEYRVLVQPLVGDHLQQPLANVRHLVPAPEQALHRRRVTQRDATAGRCNAGINDHTGESIAFRARRWVDRHSRLNLSI